MTKHEQLREAAQKVGVPQELIDRASYRLLYQVVIFYTEEQYNGKKNLQH